MSYVVSLSYLPPLPLYALCSLPMPYVPALSSQCPFLYSLPMLPSYAPVLGPYRTYAPSYAPANVPCPFLCSLLCPHAPSYAPVLCPYGPYAPSNVPFQCPYGPYIPSYVPSYVSSVLCAPSPYQDAREARSSRPCLRLLGPRRRDLPAEPLRLVLRPIAQDRPAQCNRQLSTVATSHADAARRVRRSARRRVEQRRSTDTVPKREEVRGLKRATHP